ncbi:MAG: hypothetical protein AAGB00_01295 [Planctomycetota bacterium]
MSKDKRQHRETRLSPGQLARISRLFDSPADASALGEAEAEMAGSEAALDAYIDLAIDHGNLHTWHAAARLRGGVEGDGRSSDRRRLRTSIAAWLSPAAAATSVIVAAAAVLVLSAGVDIFRWGSGHQPIAASGSEGRAPSSPVAGPVAGAGPAAPAAAVAAKPRTVWRPPAPIALSDQSPGGDLRVRLQRSFDRLEAVDYQPQNGRFGSFADGLSWPGDYRGRTALALLMLAQATERKATYLEEIVDGFPKTMNARGYFGRVFPDGCMDEQQLSSHGWVLRALCEHYRWSRDKRSLQMIRRIVENLVLPAAAMAPTYPLDQSRRRSLGRLAGSQKSSGPGWRLSRDNGCVFIFMDGVVEALKVDPTPELRRAAEAFVSLFLAADLEAMQAQTHASLAGMRAALAYHGLTSDRRVLQRVERDFERYKSTAMTETYENYNWFGRPAWTEPCGVVDSYIVAVELWRLLGDPTYLEDAHHIYYNGFAATQRRNGGFGQNYCVGPGGDFLSVKSDESHWCCTMRGAEGLVRAAQFAYFTTDESAIFAGYATNSARLGVGDSIIEVSQQSTYPFEGRSKITVESVAEPREVEFSFFSPSFARNVVVMVNGRRAHTVDAGGFASVRFKPVAGDVLDIRFDMDAGWSAPVNPRFVAGKGSLTYGPLVLAAADGGRAKALRPKPDIRSLGGGAFVADGGVVLHTLYNAFGPSVPRPGQSRQVLFERATLTKD